MSKYCANCGTELLPDVKFCSQCGKQQKQEVKVEQQIDDQSKATNCISEEDNCSDNDRLVSDLERAHVYFQQKQSAYADFDNLTNKKAEFARPNGFTLFIVGVVLAFIAWVIIGVSINAYGLESTILFWAAMFVGGVIFPISLFNKINTKVNNEIISIDQQLTGIEENLSKYFTAYPNSPVSFKYSNPKIIDVLKDNISSGRADNVKDSINCMLDDLYKQQMLTKQDEISKNVKKAADSAGAAALFSAGTFLNTRKK